ncbi:NmrA family transcriptional regulator [Actibacterium mucosum KCTC 23349]|uniref:NmrA family transcriptional regulator n=1 Tax=Actibacterium mucosum KCTC 23349 TaxID=1454373 RepID=A0A037ZHN5_9RHOB|nr:NAD(P)H-binding protein [Actibacterium mucosum]KAJ55144.1 NmrA family transcriptional regulator [Actibacterium mucosum KCTC 23349]
MTSKPILITGATGKTGSRVLARLTAAGHDARSGSRTAQPPFNWDDPDTWQKALSGIWAVYVNYHPDYAFPGAIENLTRFTHVAASCGVQRLVILTGRGEHHAQLGEKVIANSGLDHTIIRSAWFAQNFSEGSLWEPVMEGVVPMPGGDLEEPIIDIDDLADVIVTALTGTGHSGQTYECTGPRLLGFAEVADILSGAMGRRVDYLPISFDDFHAALEATSGTVFADIVTEIARETFDGRNAKIGDGVMRAIGRAPRDFTEFAQAAATAGKWAKAA